MYGGGPDHTHYSTIDQITPANVSRLQVAWTYATHDEFPGSEMQANPIVVDGVLYATTPKLRVFALDAATGRELWTFDANAGNPPASRFRHRGVVVTGDRVMFTYRNKLWALDKKTGKPIPGFGQQGTVDLRKGLRIGPTGFADYEVTSPPAVIGNTVVVGSAIADGTSKIHPSGEVRGFDAITGALKWTWDPVPQDPSAVGGDSWKGGSAARAGGANAWSVIVADPARNLVFVPTSSPSHDYFGGERPGDNLFSDSVVALRADTGTRVWHFQTVHHDLWDYDVASPPILFDWRKDGRTVAAVGVASKTGHLFILDRETGAPLIPVEERAVPKSDVPGEAASPTQPFPAAPRALAPTTLKPEEAWGATDEDRAWCRATMSALRADGFFTPPSLKGTLVVPGNVGGMAWGGIAHDRLNDLLIMPVNNLAAEVRLIPRDATETERQAGRLSGDFEYHPQLGTRYAMVRRFLLGPKTHLPCTPPPWGTLAAVKAATGEIAWQVPLGQFPGTEKVPGLENAGSIALGGPIATAGGLVFTAGTFEAAIYAFDTRTGERLWKGTLPTSARSTPMTYLGRDGRQYVVISAGGHGTAFGPPIGDYLVAFALEK